MIKYYSVLLLAGFGMAAFAQSAKELALPKLKEIYAKRAKTADCENFNGSWSGMCKTSDGRNEAIELQVDQKLCEVIAIDGDTVLVGGLSNGTQVLALSGEGKDTVVSTVLTTSGDWNESRKILTVANTIALRLLGTTEAVPIIPFEFKQVLSKEGEQLHLLMESFVANFDCYLKQK